MLLFFNYALQSAVCLLFLYLPYHFIFKKTTFYKWNRFYLLGAVLFALLAPLGDFQVRLSVSEDVKSLTTTFSEPNIFSEEKADVVMEVSDENLSVTLLEQAVSEKPNIKTDIANTEAIWSVTKAIKWLSFAYFAGVALFALLYFLRLLKLFLLIKKGKQNQHQDFIEVGLSTESKQVFSFFGFVFLNRTQFTEYELATVLKHEQVHIQHWHSVDILLMEILQIVFWFNPFYRLYNNSLQNENEYFADQLVAGKQNTSSYAETLLQLAVSKRPIAGQAFAYIPVKHRIFKLFQSPSTTMEKSKYLSALPLLSLLFVCFSCSLDELEETTIGDITGKKVSMVKAYYTGQQTAMHSKLYVGQVIFDENGNIDKLEQKQNPAFLANHADQTGLPYIDYSKYIRSNEVESSNFHALLFSDFATTHDFYAKKVQWLFVGDLAVSSGILETLFYIKNPYQIMRFEEALLVNEQGYKPLKSVATTGSLLEFDLSQEARSGTAFLHKHVAVNEHGLITTWEENFIFTVDYQKVRTVPNKEELASMSPLDMFNDGYLVSNSYEVEYNANNLPERLLEATINTSSLSTTPMIDVQKELRFAYNDDNQLEELSLYNGNGIFLRSFQFTYNEEGYCTQKRMINREGSVEFTVDFEYDFYPAE